MLTTFTETGWEDYEYWQQNDSNNVEKINTLIKDIKRNPFKGLGKPEPLRGNLAGFWSRKITSEHRLVYSVSGKDEDKRLIIIQARFHYSK